MPILDKQYVPGNPAPVPDSSHDWLGFDPIANTGGILASKDFSGVIKHYAQFNSSRWFNVLDYGIVGDGATNNSTALTTLMTVVNATSGRVVLYFPAGVYLINAGVIAPTINDFRIIGDGRFNSILLGNSAGDMIKLPSGGDGYDIRGIGVFYSAAQASGNGINTNGANDVEMDDIYFNNCFTGLNVQGSSIKVTLHDFFVSVTGAVTGTSGVVINNGAAGDTYIENGVMSTGGTVPAALYGVQMLATGHSELNRLNLTRCSHALFVNPAAAAIVAFVFANECLFDSCLTNGALLNSGTATSTIKSLKFENCWFSGTVNTNATGAAGLATTGVAGGVLDGVTFVDCRFLNNWTHGASHGYGTGVEWTGCDMRGNSQAGSNLNDGLNIAAGVSNWRVIGGKYGGTDAAETGGNQRWGINILSGASTNYEVVGPDCIGNVTGPISDNGSSANVTSTASAVQKVVGPLGGGVGRGPLAAITATASQAAATEIAVVGCYLPANSLQVGTTLRVRLHGACTSTALSTTVTFRVRYGPTTLTGTAVLTMAPVTFAAAGTTGFLLEANILVTALSATVGAVTADGIILLPSGTLSTGLSNATPANLSVRTATATLNTTVANLLQLTVALAAANATILIDQAYIECVNP